jgi:hypothetical protein
LLLSFVACGGGAIDITTTPDAAVGGIPLNGGGTSGGGTSGGTSGGGTSGGTSGGGTSGGTSGGGTSGGTSGGGTSGGTSGGVVDMSVTDPCIACQNRDPASTSCQGKKDACLADAACASLVECGDACGSDNACIQGCTSSAPISALLEANDITTCICMFCKTECGSGCP